MSKSVILFCLLLVTMRADIVKPPEQPTIDERCLSEALYREASGEPLRAVKAVLEVIKNRMHLKKKYACDIIAEKRQFSWHHLGYSFYFNEERLTRLSEVDKMEAVLGDDSYLYFYSGEKPIWARQMKCKKINHLNFCKLKGK